METITPTTTLSTQSESIKNIAAALCAALPEIPEIEKKRRARIASKTGQGYEYHYADLSDILAAATKPLAKSGLVVTWSSTPSDKGSILSANLLHAGSGEWMRASLAMPHMANPQEMGSMLSYLKRYLFGLLVPIAATEADDDGQRASKGSDDDEAAQAAILDAKRKAREEIGKKMKAEGRMTKVAPLEVKEDTSKLAEDGLAPVKVAEPPTVAPPTMPEHLQSMQFMLDEAGVTKEKFMHWATNPRPDGKGRLLPEGTKFESLAPDWVKAVTAPSKWSKISEQLK